MVAAYDGVLEELGLKDRADRRCEVVARKLIGIAQNGERDPKRLKELTLASIRT